MNQRAILSVKKDLGEAENQELSRRPNASFVFFFSFMDLVKCSLAGKKIWLIKLGTHALNGLVSESCLVLLFFSTPYTLQHAQKRFFDFSVVT